MSWTDDASCKTAISVDPQLATAWDNIDHGDKYLPDPAEAVARTICASCPVRVDCLVDAVQDPDSEGIRGGYRFHMGSMSRSEAQQLQRNFGLKARVKRGRSADYVEDFNVQGVRSND